MNISQTALILYQLLNKSNKINKHKIKHREKCIKRLPMIKKITIPDFGDITHVKEAICIEFRNLPHIEFLIRNTILKLPKWDHTIVCGNGNINMIQRICNDIQSNTKSEIKIIVLPVKHCTVLEYNKMLLSKSFWQRFQGEKLLIYQEDTMLFRNDIDRFLKYDYIGSPWIKSRKDLPIMGGNGGFSLRSKSIMIQCLSFLKGIPYSMKEDVFFSRVMFLRKIGRLANFNTAREFSQERVSSDNPLGGHAFWLARNNLESRW